MLLNLVVGIGVLQSATAFYLPGLVPHSYCNETSEDASCKSVVDLYVNRLTSSKTVIPYDYSLFDFCEPEDKVGKKGISENLGQVLFGERIYTSPYQFSFNKNESCRSVCKRIYHPTDKDHSKKLELLKYGMLFSYEHHWVVDNMPVAWCYWTNIGQQYCRTGFPMGCYVDKEGEQKDACQINALFNKADSFYLFNHVDIHIRFHSGDGKGARIVKVTVNPRSFNSGYCTGIPLSFLKNTTENVEIEYTYSVFFIPDNSIEWASRWDYLLDMDSLPSTNLQWFSIMNSLVIVLYLSGMVAINMFRSFRKDTRIYNQMEYAVYLQDKAEKMFRWKLLHGDVFRPPKKPMLFAVLIGGGYWIFVMTFVIWILACLGFLSPANRDALGITVLLFVYLGILSGYTSARLYKTFGGECSKTNAMMTSFLVSGYIFAIIFFMNLILWGAGSSAAIPFFTLVADLAPWFGISVPLTFIGAYFGYKKRLFIHKAEQMFRWKLLHGDVFRPPKKPMLFAVLIGVGTQIFVMTFVTLILACLGFLSPANRGALGTTSVVLFVCLGIVSGYTSARLYKTFGGECWKTNAMMTSFLVSGYIFAIIFFMNLIFWGAGSSAAIPFFTLVAVLALWFGISVPLTFIGAYFGYKKRPIEHPVRTNQIPRQIPPQSICTRAAVYILWGGLLSFGCISNQLFFILSSIWYHQFYHMFGFLLLVAFILVIICSETAVLLCHFHLAKEDYRWWWSSFFASGFTAVYFLIYAMHFYVTKLAIEGVTSAILYFGYSLIMAIMLFLFCGTTGFMACFWFVTKIYSAVTVDDVLMADTEKVDSVEMAGSVEKVDDVMTAGSIEG